MDFENYLKPHWDDLVRYSRALAGSHDRGDDLLQNALLRAFKAWPGLRDRERFKHWLISIIRNTHISEARLRWVKRLVRIEEADAVAVEEGLSFDERELMRQALQKLPVAQREALILFEILGYNVAQVAEIQNVSLSAVKSRLARGREKLLEAYNRLSDPDPANSLDRTQSLAAVKGGDERGS